MTDCIYKLHIELFYANYMLSCNYYYDKDAVVQTILKTLHCKLNCPSDFFYP